MMRKCAKTLVSSIPNSFYNVKKKHFYNMTLKPTKTKAEEY